MTAKDKCTVEGCASTASKKGMCNAHYLRKRRHGDANFVARPGNGSVREWIESHLDFAGDDCLIWPFARGRDGRGRMYTEDGAAQAHRVMCTLVLGEPPTPKHEAAHSCGKGHEGCVNPRHLKWATPRENAADRKAHGTEVLGEARWSAKLNRSQVRRIRAIPESRTCAEIAEAFGVGTETIRDIRKGRTWKWLGLPETGSTLNA